MTGLGFRFGFSAETSWPVPALGRDRGSIAGDFVYHCHIMGHEDSGMMAVIRVLPSATAAAGAEVHAKLEGQAKRVDTSSEVK